MSKTFKKVPGPRGGPLLGVLPQMRRDPLKLFLESVRKYGPICLFPLGVKRAYLLSTPDLIRGGFVENHSSLVRRDLYDRLKQVLGMGLVTSDGAVWKKHRVMIQPVFGVQNVLSFYPLIEDAVAQCISRWHQAAKSGAVLDINVEMARLTSDIIFRVMFSASFDDREVQKAFVYLNDVTGQRLWRLTNLRRLLPIPENFRYNHSIAVLDNAIGTNIDERRKLGSDRHDLLSRLMAVRDSSGGIPLSDREIRDQLVTFAFAGHDTTASTLSWSIYEIAKNPELGEKVFSEEAKMDLASLQGVLTKSEGLYAKAIFQETMRRYPAAWFFTRTVEKEFELREYLIPQGRMIMASPYVMHHLEEYWSDPFEFRPERFIGGKVAEGSFIPFGVGPHHCIGSMLATLEATMILTMLCSTFSFELQNSFEVKPLPLVTLKPGEPILVKLKQRNQKIRAA